MSLPTLILYERHWDPVPKEFLLEGVEELLQMGYDTLCVEAGESWSEESILRSCKQGLETQKRVHKESVECLKKAGALPGGDLGEIPFDHLRLLIREWVSSQRYDEVAEMIKGLFSTKLAVKLFERVRNLSMNLYGIDLEGADYEKIRTGNYRDRVRNIDRTTEKREARFMHHLLHLQAQGRSVICLMGVSHIEGMRNKIQVQEATHRFACAFIHSGIPYVQTGDDIAHVLKRLKNELALKAKSPVERRDALDQVMSALFSKNVSHLEEVTQNCSHAGRLSRILQAEVKAFVKPGRYVEVILLGSAYPSILSKIAQMGLPYYFKIYNEKVCIAIDRVNVAEQGERIQRAFRKIHPESPRPKVHETY